MATPFVLPSKFCSLNSHFPKSQITFIINRETIFLTKACRASLYGLKPTTGVFKKKARRCMLFQGSHFTLEQDN